MARQQLITARDMTRRGVMAAGVTVAVINPVQARTNDTTESVSVGAYPSRDQSITVVVFRPPAQGLVMEGAAILLLHGGSGAGLELERWYAHAVWLAGRGYVVAYPAWFGDAAQGGRGLRGEAGRQRQAVVDGVAWLASQPGVNPARIATLGFSRGGFIASDVAVTEAEAEVAAVVSIAAGGSREVSAISRKPPTLLIYADGDPVVRAGRVLAWERTLRRAGVPVVTEVLDVDHHVPEPAEWRAIFERAHSFLRRALVVRP